jgi:predicted thioesterase
MAVNMAFVIESALAAALARATGQADLVVGEAHTAIAAGSGDLPVLATPMMIALMEAAACAALAGHLPYDVTSVGARVDVRHLAPSAVGSSVAARAHVIEVSESAVTFAVEATHDRSGEHLPIGRGTHVRVLVDREPFMHAL